jgi:hypothetical protein
MIDVILVMMSGLGLGGFGGFGSPSAGVLLTAWCLPHAVVESDLVWVAAESEAQDAAWRAGLS